MRVDLSEWTSGPNPAVPTDTGRLLALPNGRVALLAGRFPGIGRMVGADSAIHRIRALRYPVL